MSRDRLLPNIRGGRLKLLAAFSVAKISLGLLGRLESSPWSSVGWHFSFFDPGVGFFHQAFVGGREFWSTAMAKTINMEAQIHAWLNDKEIIITESSVRRDLRLSDEEGVDCLPNSTIFENLEFIGTMASAIICLATNQKFNFSKLIVDSMIRNLDNVSGKFLMYPSVADEAVYKELDDRLVRVVTTASTLKVEQDSGDTIAQTRFENVSKLSNDSLLARGNTLQSDEDRMKLNELMKLCTNLQTRILDLEKTKTTQAMEITNLKKRVKKLEKKQRSKTHKLKRLYKVGLIARVDYSKDKQSLGKDASKHEKKINDIDVDEDITLVNDQDNAEMFDVNDLHGEEVFVKKKLLIKSSELVQGNEKRVGEELIQKRAKKQKVDDDKEMAELKELMEIILDKEEVAIDAISLAVKSLKIVD
nr:hypothetical protein [Tanacetum cinerariifolium]